MSKIGNKINELLNGYRGWRANEKIVVFESDDWGSIRTTNNKALDDLRRLGAAVDNCHYLMNDSLETPADLVDLFSVLNKYKDCDGNPPVFTFNTIMANPNFLKIQESDFNKYYFTPFTESYKNIFSDDILKIWKSGIKEGFIYPQFHGREHVNIRRWLGDLRRGREDTHVAFTHGMYGISGHVVKQKRGSYLAVFDEIGEDNNFINGYLSEGFAIFKSVFGFDPKTFIAPNYVWSREVETESSKQGIIAMQGSATQILPSKNEQKTGIIKNYIGKKSIDNMGYLMRNVVFEPSSAPSKDWVSSALDQMDAAFKQNRPVIIDSHRVNYVGSLNTNNRTESLKSLDELLKKMFRKWPDIKFYHSEKLAELIYE